MVFVFFGLVAVVGTTFVQTQSWEWAALFGGVGIGSLACAILVANNLRDIPTDTIAGKRTLAVRLGARGTRRLYGLLMVVATVAVPALAATTTWWCLLGLGFWSVALRPTRAVLADADGRALIPVLQQTGLAQLVWALLVALPLIASGVG